MNYWKLSTISLVVILGCIVGRGVINSASAEPQPNMTAALTLLQDAKGTLEKATPDKGGHRERAIDLTKQAISEVKAGIEYANKQSKGGNKTGNAKNSD